MNKKKNRFISHSEYLDLLNNIEMNEELNAEYYITLVMAVYEGIYSEDMSVIANARASDINIDKNTIILRPEEGEPYEFEISHELAVNMVKLSKEAYWYRRNRNAVCEVLISGRHYDSVFKVEQRGGIDTLKNYHFAYMVRLRRINTIYFPDGAVKPRAMYVSGIMYRIIENLKANGVSPEYALTFGNRRGEIKYIKDELVRSHYPSVSFYNSFRQLTNNYVDLFIE